MKDTRLLKIIRTFTKEELKSFEKFLLSPFLKPARDTSELYYYIIKYFPEYDSPKLEKEVAFVKLFGKEAYNEKKITNLIFDLTRAAEQFMAYNIYAEDETGMLINLSKALQRKKLSEESLKVNKQIEKSIKTGFAPGNDYLSKFRQLTLLKSNYFVEENSYENVILCKKNYFEALATQFIVYYTDLISSIVPSKNTYGKIINDDFIENVILSFDIEKLIKALEKSEPKNKHLILMHYYLLKTNTEKDSDSFYYLFRDLFFELIPELEREERYILFNNLVHYCVLNYGRENMDFKKEMFDVYKKMVETGSYSLSENEYMQEMTYRNIFFGCITMRDTEYLQYFIEKYSDEIQPEQRSNMKNYACGYLHYIKNDFEKAMSYASKINQEYFLFKPDLKNLLLIIYYELGYTEQAFSLIDSYKHFISNTKEIQDNFKIVYSNYLKYYSGLLKIKCGQSKETPLYIKKQIEKEKLIVSRKWLMDKADELISGKNKT
jgi:hypothetical protein